MIDDQAPVKGRLILFFNIRVGSKPCSSTFGGSGLLGGKPCSGSRFLGSKPGGSQLGGCELDRRIRSRTARGRSGSSAT